MSAALNGWQALKQGELHPFPNVRSWAGMRLRIYVLAHQCINASIQRDTNTLKCLATYAKIP